MKRILRALQLYGTTRPLASPSVEDEGKEVPRQRKEGYRGNVMGCKERND